VTGTDVVLRRAHHDLRAAGDLVAIGHVVRTVARQVTGAAGATFVLRDGDNCFYADEDAIAPLWKGQRFPIETCISGWAMLHEETALVPDIETDPRIPLAAYRPTFVRSVVMAPAGSPAAAAIGAYWPLPRTPHPDEVRGLEQLAAITGAAVARVGLADAPWAPNFRLDDPDASSIGV
jgi:two-component system CheB/CheR fusion protein